VKFKIDGTLCYKVGITRHVDVVNRFAEDLRAKRITEFKVIKSGYIHSERDALKLEDTLMESIFKSFPDNNYYPDPENPKRGQFHNFFTKTKLGGITETRIFDYKEVGLALEFIKENTYINIKDFNNARIK
jgi:hypothetical protein